MYPCCTVLAIIRNYPSTEYVVADDSKPYTAFSYANGPSEKLHRDGYRRLNLEYVDDEYFPSISEYRDIIVYMITTCLV